MYPLLRRVNRLPTVAVVQILINGAMRRGEQIAVDGIFGPGTRRAVVEFQRDHGLSRDGVVGRNTWAALTRGQDLQVIDAVDVTDPSDIGMEDADIIGAGGNPIVSHGMCDGVRVVTDKIISRARAGRVALLRFHGHGAPGEMSITVGTGGHASSEFSLQYLSSLVTFLARMRSIFGSFSSVELHGCRVAAGANGRRLVRGLCTAWGVPVTAGRRAQYGGGYSTFRFEGPTFTAFPGGVGLKSWARSLPEAGLMCVDR